METDMQPKESLWMAFNYLCVGVAYFMLCLSIWFMPVNLATKGYVGMGILFLTGSLVTLVKTVYDQRQASEFTSKLEKAKQEKLLSEYVAKA
jgi:hypothetical protein